MNDLQDSTVFREKIMDSSYVFYQKSTGRIVDVVDPRTKKGFYRKQTLAQVQAHRKTVICVPWQKAEELQAQREFRQC